MPNYPDVEQLERIRHWDHQDARGWLKYAVSLWEWPDWGSAWRGGELALHTGGWSGNEEIIEAMEDNAMLWLLTWQESRRGGHFKFKVRQT